MRSPKTERALQIRAGLRETESIITDLLDELKQRIADQARLEAELDEIRLTTCERQWVCSQEKTDSELHAEWEEAR